MQYQAKPARLIVCERKAEWAVALRRELAGAGLRIWETRSLEDCGTLIGESPASFVILELNKKIVLEVLDWLRTWETEFPHARFAVVADRELECYQWLMLEAGAVVFICSPRKAAVLAQIACRHLALVPPLPQTLAERIWTNLPWPTA